jgi:hypothetical protein
MAQFLLSRRYYKVSFRVSNYRAAAKDMLGIINFSFTNRVIGTMQKL